MSAQGERAGAGLGILSRKLDLHMEHTAEPGAAVLGNQLGGE